MGALYYSFYLDAPHRDQMMIFPDGCIDLIICCNKDNPTANICGSITKEREGIFSNAGCDVFSIRFLPGYADRFLKHSASHFTDQEIPLQDVIPNAEQLLTHISNETSMQRRMTIFEGFYNQVSRQDYEIPLLVKYITEQITTSNGAISMVDLSQDIGYSSRYISKLFNEYVGMSPKLFSRIVRFQHVLDALLKGNYEGILEEIMELGYYDQNHFIKEFKAFCSFTPKKYIEYQASLPM
ncbi:hypothetical protein BVG16_22015 [Paenibacillus selenitireducens]|uniref:HTH araC/xylS-type domain-containing protein n=2 Tax=Paenibacillus selenitireducens TaxID=1324314 RepID=A0A1T2X643_9BACL|nr:hypothetical protein BVG16_22015 [Paenibacillus selenitireducens]